MAKVVGIAVEAGSMLSGHSGEMVSAEGKVAEADAEHFIDSIDGEDYAEPLTPREEGRLRSRRPS